MDRRKFLSTALALPVALVEGGCKLPHEAAAATPCQAPPLQRFESGEEKFGWRLSEVGYARDVKEWEPEAFFVYYEGRLVASFSDKQLTAGEWLKFCAAALKPLSVPIAYYPGLRDDLVNAYEFARLVMQQRLPEAMEWFEPHNINPDSYLSCYVRLCSTLEREQESCDESCLV